MVIHPRPLSIEMHHIDIFWRIRSCRLIVIPHLLHPPYATTL